YVLYGEEHYLIKKELDRIIEKHITFEKEMNTSIFDASKTSMEEIIADAQTIPFFSDYKAVVIHQATFLSAQGSDDKAGLEVLNRYLDAPNESTILIFTCNQAKLDSRKKIVKRLNKEAKVLQFSMFDDFTREKFIKEYCQKKQVVLSKDALQEFYYRIGYSPARIISELDKLSLYAKQIEKEDVINLVMRLMDDNVFDIFQAILRHDFARAYRYWLDFNAQNIDPIALIAMLASQYRFLHQVKILQIAGLNKSEIASRLNAHPFRVSKNLEHCGYINERELSRSLNDLACLDQKIKAGKIDKKFGFEMFLIERGK
ncbi:MAG: DNA polymerase III subunit delta, partial [Erysipelotrichia bacterium]|nr:DNA polymerase III subunit delta [Erysipelotrichia bacterium]